MTKLHTLRNFALATGTVALLFAGTALSQEGHGARQGDSKQHRQLQGQQGHKGQMGQMRGSNRQAIQEELGLTDEQKEKLQALRRDARKTRIRSRADHQILRLDMAALMRADNPDRSAITAKLKEISALRTSQVLAGLDNHAAMREILTPEQWEKMKTFRRHASQRFQQRRMRRGARRGGPRGMQGRPGGEGRGMGGPDEGEIDDELELEEDSFPADEPRL